jgi:hypothetical protein
LIGTETTQNTNDSMKTTLCLTLLSASLALAATEEQINETFSVSPGGNLVVDVHYGSITVESHEANEVVVDVWRKAKDEDLLSKNPVVIEQEGDTVTITAEYEARKGLFKGGWKKQIQARYTIHVPEQFNADLSTRGGPVSVTGLTGEVEAHSSGGGLKLKQLTGPVDAHTSGGAVEVTDCEGDMEVGTSGGGIRVSGGGGSLEAETSGGKIVVKEFNGDTEVETSGGGIILENVTGAVEGHTSGGGVTAILPGPELKEVSLSTSGGGVTVKVPEDAAFNLDARSSGGGVGSDLPVTIVGNKSSSRLEGTVNGGGPLVRLRSSGGGIHVKKL